MKIYGINPRNVGCPIVCSLDFSSIPRYPNKLPTSRWRKYAMTKMFIHTLEDDAEEWFKISNQKEISSFAGLSVLQVLGS